MRAANAAYFGVRTMVKLISFFVVFSVSSFVEASIDKPLTWNKVEVTTHNNVKIKIELESDSMKIREFIIDDGDKTLLLNQNLYSDILQPDLSSIRVSEGCQPLTMEGDKLQGIPICNLQISFEIIEISDLENEPIWYENPQVTFFIRNASIDKRLMTKKKSESMRSLQWMGSDGTITKKKMIDND